MFRKPGIVGISICFTLGIGTGEALRAYIGTVTAALGALAVLLLSLLRTKARMQLLREGLLFFLLGLLCATVGELRGGSLLHFAQAERAADLLRERIAHIPFQGNDTAVLLSAFLTGDRSGLSTEIRDLFRASGASHLLALSGLHIGILYSLLRKALLLFGHSPRIRRIRSIATLLLAGFYTLMVGAGPSIVRAFLFIALRESLDLGRRKAPAAHILFTALMIQLCLQPQSLRSLGFQLSYLAVAGILLIYPRLSPLFPGGGGAAPLKRIWDAAMLSLSCQAFTAPLVWYYFGHLPLFFLLCNLIAIPLCTAVISTAIGCILLTATGLPAGAVIRVCDLLVNCLEESLRILAQLSTA